MFDFLGFALRTGRGGLGPWVAAAIALSCTGEGGHYFDEPPPSPGGQAGKAGATALGGRSGAGGSAGLSAAGGTSAGRGGSGDGGTSTTGGTGGSGGSGGTSEPVGGSAGVGSTGGGVSGGSAGLGGGTGGTSGVGGTSEGGDAGDVGVAGAGGEPCVAAPEVCDGVSNDCDEQVDEGGVCPTDCAAKTRGGHVYLLCVTTNESSQLAYEGATAYCDSAGELLDLGVTLALARIEDQEESNFARDWVRDTTTAAGMVWLGANDLEQENKWVWGRGAGAAQFFTGSNQGGGMPYRGAFNDWGMDRPNSSNGADEDCGAMDSEFDWQWNDILCQTKRIGLLCEQTP